MLTTIDVDEAALEAEAIAQDWEAEFQRAFQAPLILARSLQAMLALPAEMRPLVQGDPKRLARVGQRLERMRRTYG